MGSLNLRLALDSQKSSSSLWPASSYFIPLTSEYLVQSLHLDLSIRISIYLSYDANRCNKDFIGLPLDRATRRRVSLEKLIWFVSKSWNWVEWFYMKCRRFCEGSISLAFLSNLNHFKSQETTGHWGREREEERALQDFLDNTRPNW